jgi:hypothetical protein
MVRCQENMEKRTQTTRACNLVLAACLDFNPEKALRMYISFPLDISLLSSSFVYTRPKFVSFSRLAVHTARKYSTREARTEGPKDLAWTDQKRFSL